MIDMRGRLERVYEQRYQSRSWATSDRDPMAGRRNRCISSPGQFLEVSKIFARIPDKLDGVSVCPCELQDVRIRDNPGDCETRRATQGDGLTQHWLLLDRLRL